MKCDLNVIYDTGGVDECTRPGKCQQNRHFAATSAFSNYLPLCDNSAPLTEQQQVLVPPFWNQQLLFHLYV